MTIVFLNRMEIEKEHEVQAANVWIEEQDGLWICGWNQEVEFHSSEDQRDTWYEGADWNEMLAVYRHKLASKLAEGYRPIIRDTFQEFLESGQRGRYTQKLICYSELHADEELYKQLAAWRRVRATEEHRAPYLIATNRALRLIGTFLPQTLEELRELPGIGEHTVNRYGEALIAHTQDIERKHAFPLDWVEHRLNEEEFEAWTYTSKERKFKREAERVRANRLLLESMEPHSDYVSLTLISQESGMQRRELIEMMESLQKDGYHFEEIVQHEVQLVSESQLAAIEQAYQEIGDTFLKPVLKKVYGEELPSESGTDLLYEQLRLLRIRYRQRAERVAAELIGSEQLSTTPKVVVTPSKRSKSQAAATGTE
ncbi:HRDC domain-containing protein [Saccharibacillus sp. JS10]|uniref:HRDC domain-containing protein n=1 Tax=Saccharibacillus sp. JS10 TaxID=2950552 RepID=UPI00210C4F61|nr:HRDC domain-containing protein [Saccharibacillus sp. JS10]MCQ4086870.1 HRDC domain-containing protein [Saccharibacillus sp. JS10]